MIQSWSSHGGVAHDFVLGCFGFVDDIMITIMHYHHDYRRAATLASGDQACASPITPHWIHMLPGGTITAR